MPIKRRDFLATSAALAGVAGLGIRPSFAQAEPSYKPEEGASLRLLRWTPFVKGDEDAWIANTKKFTEATGVEVRIDKESWEDIRPKAAVAANVGSGPDMVMCWFDDAHQYPDKLVDLTELADYLGNKYGGWYDGLKGYASRDGQFIAMPLAAIGNAVCYRESHMKAAGFSEFPKDTAGFLELCKALKAKGTPAGFPHGKAVGDGNNYAHWLLWSHGGKMVDESGKVTINSPETLAAVNYAKSLYETFIPGTESWLDINNNRAFLAGQVSLTANGVSLYYAAKKDAALAELAADIRTTNFPVGPVGQSVELHQTSSILLFKHSKYPEAAKAYLKFMMEADQMNAWIEGSSAYCCQPLKAFADNPVWTSDPIHAPYARASETLRPNGYAGPLGYASAGVMADYVLVDMFASAVTGQATPEDAVIEAERRANRYYRV
ncbi:carbohydrate ABC transporter substrate-binding protein (plasmid) [Sinorhizobium meliloti WSM1022]|jgi:multiple sugar transport system substrate-binding protein|uniref:Sugar uptake ABC transporter periplasmic solute-binding protein n=2 Tax=Rhizobium meliloti TaxID=382 RepID=Q926E9_RHIME|nr:ABC transporter substrate-binding protein [Sinorhizobium meliloti]TWB00807.1 carbohydrate ABC transporter substrate-binding protein (CUT1 family) [Ensifer sp. SEMIA 134]TWB37454.1 carbohydrate ABC transporter substrate-binding protein (CUT1 family) [Ensifer sp. SEMIA 135]AEG09128.1 extracellular solute-binding protein family 1 [Sinorhizobium meliloti BL225C]AEG56054.1 extracellular solute-binding protein family 1 [Sinorhizobium meliloti AK83]AGA10373.1 ABC-type sugar transport system, perip